MFRSVNGGGGRGIIVIDFQYFCSSCVVLD